MTEEKKREQKGSTVVKKQDGKRKTSGSTVVKKQAPKHAKKERDWDDDLFLDDVPAKSKKVHAPHSRSARRAKARRKARAQRTAWGTLAFAAACVCALAVSFCWISMTRYTQFAKMRALLDRDTFYPGVTVDGIDLSGYTLPEALEMMLGREMDSAQSREIVFKAGEDELVRDAAELGFGSNYEAIVKAAWKFGREGSLEQRYAQAQAGREYAVDRGFDEGMLRSASEQIAASLTRDSVDAQIVDFIYNKGQFVFSEAQEGAYVDGDELYAQTLAVLEAGGNEVRVNSVTIEPDVTAEELAGMYGEISTAVTNASSSSNNRINNIRLACEAINCMKLEPGQSFSFNETVGKRTSEAGYKKAGVYISGDVGEEIGGGICQVSTTLFNAVVKADLEITERHNHSLPVSYVDNGKDATVNWGSKDLKFVNSGDEPVYIIAFVTDDWRVRVHVYGRLREDGLTISLVPVLQETTKPGDEQYVYTTELPTGEMRLKSKARNGYRVNTYKAYSDENGDVVEKVFLCSSHYPARGAVIEVGQ